MLKLNRPIYEVTSAYGHFGRKPTDKGEFSWEKTIAPTGISFVDEKWGSYKNNMYVGDCRGNLYKFQLNDSRDELIFENQDLQDFLIKLSSKTSCIKPAQTVSISK